MQDKHADLHFMMVAALVFVAASAIFQTALGLDADKLGTAESQRMFATVAAASGAASSPKVEQVTKQMRSIDISDTAHARIRGVVKSTTTGAFSVSTWGGEWRIVLSSGTKALGQQGPLGLNAIKEGDYVLVEGLAENSGSPVISAQVVNDYTLYRVPAVKDGAKLRSPLVSAPTLSDDSLQATSSYVGATLIK
jgi:hypothetical protein